MKKNIGIFCILLLSGCNTPPPAAPVARAAAPPPVISTEVVNMSLTTREHLTRLANLVMNETPTRAELGCSISDSLCMEARKMLAAGGIPVHMAGVPGVRLIYEYMAVASALPPAIAAPDLAPAADSPPSLLPPPSLLLQSIPR